MLVAVMLIGRRLMMGADGAGKSSLVIPFHFLPSSFVTSVVENQIERFSHDAQPLFMV
jgi:predicted ATPase